MSVRAVPGSRPHVQWIDLHNNGVMVECLVMKEDASNNKYFIEIRSLDSIDRNRVARLLSHRHAASMPLWDLMSQVTLNNGINALDYFHQLVKIITVDGHIMNPRAGTHGTGTHTLQEAAPAKKAGKAKAAKVQDSESDE